MKVCLDPVLCCLTATSLQSHEPVLEVLMADDNNLQSCMQHKHTTDSTAVSMPTSIVFVRLGEEQAYHFSGDTLVSGVAAARTS